MDPWIAWLSGCWVPNATQISFQILQKSMVGGLLRASWGGLGGSWRLLGGSWGPLNPKVAPGPKNDPQTKSFDPLLGGHLGAPNRLKAVLINFFVTFGIDIWSDVVEFGPNLAPQAVPKWNQVGSKIDASWGVDLRVIF